MPRAAHRRPHHRAHQPFARGRPEVLGDRTSHTLYEGMQGMLENTFPNIKNRSSKITAEIEVALEVAPMK